MFKTIILIAGMPATGKTTFANYLSKKLQLTLVCKDQIKELLWDKLQYDTTIRSEGQKYGALSYDLSLHFCDLLMNSNQSFIFESNFYKTCPEELDFKINESNYKVITVLFDGDIEVIHKRFLHRDITDERHPGLVIHNHFDDIEYFKEVTQPNREFNYGDEIIKINLTDFNSVSYDDIIDCIIEKSKQAITSNFNN
jgi:2-phosphoglycerate kinase